MSHTHTEREEAIQIPDAKVAKFREALADDILYQIYVGEYNIANAIDELKTLQGDEKRSEALTDINTRHAATFKLTTDKVSSVRNKAKIDLEKIGYEKSKLVNTLNDQYRKISELGQHLANLKASFLFASTFNHTEVPSLSYAEINGTRYEMKNNIITTNALGHMNLYLEPTKNVKDHSTQKN